MQLKKICSNDKRKKFFQSRTYFGFRLESFVIKKRFRLLFGDEFDKEEYKKTKKHLKYIKQNRDLVSIVYVIHV